MEVVLVRNVHERVLAAPADRVGALLDRLAGPDDPLWPAPAWPALRLDRPLAVGADGGHDGIRYHVVAYEPRRRVEFRFHPATGLDGSHVFEVEPIDPDRCVLRHVLVATPRGRMRILVPLAVRWLHDAVIEDLLDNAERAATPTTPRSRRYSTWVRTLRWMSGPRAAATAIPAAATLVGSELGRLDYSDAYSISVDPGVSTDARAWADAFCADSTGMTSLPRLAETDHEVLLGADEKLLAYRAVVLVESTSERITVTVATVVSLRSAAGRAYFAVVRRIHPWLVRLLLRRAAMRLLREPATMAG